MKRGNIVFYIEIESFNNRKFICIMLTPSQPGTKEKCFNLIRDIYVVTNSKNHLMMSATAFLLRYGNCEYQCPYPLN